MSERSLHANVSVGVMAQLVRPALLCEIQFPTGTVNIWTGQGTITWDSKTWTGTGELVGFSSFPETTDGSSQGTQIILSGIDSTILDDSVNDEFQGSPVSIWVAILSESGTVTADPFKQFGGLIDTGEIRDDGEKATITINAESRLIDHLRPRQWRYTNQDQQKLYPGDKGFEFIATTPDRQLVWRS